MSRFPRFYLACPGLLRFKLVPDQELLRAFRNDRLYGLDVGRPSSIGERSFWIDLMYWSKRPSRAQVVRAIRDELDVAEFRRYEPRPNAAEQLKKMMDQKTPD